MSEVHTCNLPDVGIWLLTEGDAEVTCPECGVQWGPAFGYGSGDSSGWVRLTEERP